MESSYSPERQCYDNYCHCDWRLTLYGCVESQAIRIIYIFNIVISALVSVVGIGILFHRVIIKGHRFMDYNPAKGYLRPKPIDSMLLFLTLFNIFRLVTSAILLTDAAPDNTIFRSYIYEAPWEFGYWSFTLYLIGIAQALSESHESMSDSWLPSPRTVDIIGLALLCSPLFTNNTLSLTAGILAKSNPKVAGTCIQLLYLFWTFYIACVTTSVLYCGSRLIQTLNKHLKKFNPTGERYKEVKTGLFKIYSMMGLISVSLFLFGAQCLIYGAIRNLILKNYIGNIFLCAIWTLLAPATTVFVEISIIFNPPINNEPRNIPLKSSEGEQTTTVFEIQNAMKLSRGGADMTFEDTLTNGALEDLELEYDQALKSQHENNMLKSNWKGNSHYFYTKKPGGFHIGESEASTNVTTLTDKGLEPNSLLNDVKDNNHT